MRVLMITSTPPIPSGGGSMLLYRHFCDRDDFRPFFHFRLDESRKCLRRVGHSIGIEISQLLDDFGIGDGAQNPREPAQGHEADRDGHGRKADRCFYRTV